jgi:hypothetical protein
MRMNGAVCAGRAGSYKKDFWGNPVSSVPEAVKKKASWKGATVQRGLEQGS